MDTEEERLRVRRGALVSEESDEKQGVDIDLVTPPLSRLRLRPQIVANAPSPLDIDIPVANAPSPLEIDLVSPVLPRYQLRERQPRRPRITSDIGAEFERRMGRSESEELPYPSERSSERGYVIPDEGFSPRTQRAKKKVYRTVEDDNEDLAHALEVLYQGRWEEFLQHTIIRRMFGPAKALIAQATGLGGERSKMDLLWRLAWAGRLSRQKMNRSLLETECISCCRSKTVQYQLNEHTEDGRIIPLGHIGAVCWLRLKALLNLIHLSKKLAELLVTSHIRPNTQRFADEIIKPIQQSLDEIAATPGEVQEKGEAIRKYI